MQGLDDILFQVVVHDVMNALACVVPLDSSVPIFDLILHPTLIFQIFSSMQKHLPKM